MNKALYNFIFIALISFVFINCANRGTPQGGPKDIEPPKILKSEPENLSTNFTEQEIRIYFNEYIKIKDLQKQLIISPPMDPKPEITPLGGANKYISIKIIDTLEANTTYALNFGNSIVDNNEENPYPFYRYVFSTGDYIDSLTVKGQVFDALEKQPDDFVSVVLYEVDSTFTDSIIYKKTPKYVTNTLDSLTTFTIENVKAGQYMLIALKDGNQDYKFQQKTDKIGFHKSFINVPTDSIYNIKLFKEDIEFNATRPNLVSNEKIVFGYEGDYKGMNISILSEIPEDFEYTITKDEIADTLYYWYKPKLEVDSLVFNVTKDDFTKDFTLKIRSKEQDSLKINPKTTGNINFNEPYKISASTPFKAFDETKISIIDKDSLAIAFKSTFDSISNIVALDFEKTESNNYKIQMLPNSLTDFYGHSNDTLNFSIRTKAFSDYGNVRVSLKNAKYPIIIQLTDEKGEVKAEQFSNEPKFFDFRYVNPGNYLLRVIFDSNGNKIFDSGNYLKKQQPERVSYYPESIDVRANWDEIREFILLD
jgi:uncharacterized protein (DUF2141 family)